MEWRQLDSDPVMARLARFVERRRRWVVAGAILFFIAGGAFGSTAFDVLKPFGFEDPDKESIVGRERLEEAAGVSPGPGLVALVRLKEPLETAESIEHVEDVRLTFAAEKTVGKTLSFVQTGDPSFVAEDQSSTFVLAFFRAGVEDEDAQETFVSVEEKLADDESVKVGGLAASYEQIGSTVERDLQRAEMFAFPILFLLSFWIFRSLVAAALPLLVGGLAIVGSILGLRLIAEVTELSIFAVNLVTGMGVGLAIDYSLFVVSRYREEIARTRSGKKALTTTMRTAGRTVLFSALTVAAAMVALTVFPQRFLYSMGVGGSLVALFSGFVALTVLPAILAMLGKRVNALAPQRMRQAAEDSARPATSGFWYRLSHFVMRRPIGVATLAAAIMLAAGSPFLGVQFTFADAGILPKDLSSRQVDDILNAKYPPNRDVPIQLEVEARPGQREALASFASRVEARRGVEAIRGPLPVSPEVQQIDVYYRDPPFSDATGVLVEDLRELQAPFEYRVAGAPAEFIDQNESLLEHLPLSMAILISGTLIVLFLMTGSVILPIKSVIMNFLTVSVAFGTLVLVFQDGRFEDLLAYSSQGALDSSNAVLIFAVIFGLSTDYGVFLLTRIKEARDNGASEEEAIATGMERTGRLITAAALLLAVALGAFVTSEIIFIKQFAIGGAIGVLVDATIVRGLLVPSLMRLLGRWNWWAPRPLRWLHGRFGLSEGHPAPAK